MIFFRFAMVFVWGFASLFAEPDRRSSLPYISGDTFRTACDFTFDELGKSLDPSAVQEGDTVFVKIDFVDEFFQRIHPLISARYIVVTHNGDCAVEPRFEKYLEDNKVIAWFGQNVEASHPRIHPIPIGIANRCWPHGSVETVAKVQELLPAIEKNTFLYMNFVVGNYVKERGLVADLFKDKPYCLVSSPKSYEEYLLELAQSVFVLSPRGNGIDCHRTWEALLMGAIPIVKTSSLDPLYDKLPVLIVQDWHEVDLAFLEKKYHEMQGQEYDLRRIYGAYWLELIESSK